MIQIDKNLLNLMNLQFLIIKIINDTFINLKILNYKKCIISLFLTSHQKLRLYLII